MPGTENLSDAEWLERRFEFEYCSECGGDAEDHVVVRTLFGKPFAYCKRGLVEDEEVSAD